MSTRAANLVTCVIDGTPQVVLLESFHNNIGPEPASAEVLLANLFADETPSSAWNGKTAVLAVDGATILTGHVWDVSKRLSDRSLRLLLQDRRMFINKTYVGANHLESLDASGLPTTTNGVKVLGADIIFNRNGKPNKDVDTGIYLGSPVAPNFVYNKAENASPECSTAEADYWTHGDILWWLFNHYTDSGDFTNRADVIDLSPVFFPSSGGLNTDAGELNLFGLEVGKAIEEVMQRCRAGWTLDGLGNLKVFTIADPADSLALAVGDPASPDGDCSNPPVNAPSELVVQESLADAVTQMDVVGGHHVRQIKPVVDDWYAGAPDVNLQASTGEVEGVSHGGVKPWANCGVAYASTYFDQQGDRVRWVFDHARYTAHNCGQNIRQKDRAKPILGELLFKRDKYGFYTLTDDECGIYGVSIMESLMQQYPGLAQLDADRFEVLARYDPYLTRPTNDGYVDSPVFSSQKPLWMVAPVVCEFRCYKTASGTLTGIPTGIRRVVLREDFIQQTTEAVDMPLPSVGEVLSIGQWHVLPQIPIPAGWTGSYPTVFTGSLTPTDYVLTTPAGVLVDALALLDKVVDVVEPEVAKRQVSVRGEFPTFHNLEPGTLLTSGSPSAYDLTDEEIVIAVAFDGREQITSFQAMNRLGAGITELANSFIDSRPYRRSIRR